MRFLSRFANDIKCFNSFLYSLSTIHYPKDV